MNLKNRYSPVIFSIGVLASGLLAAAAFHHQPTAAQSEVASVIISAKRMTEEQKIAYDLQLNSSVQTVIVTGKRLSAEEKFALDRQDQQNRQANVRMQKKPQLLV